MNFLRPGRLLIRLAIAAALIAGLAPILGPALIPGAFADNPPRKVLSGWLPYYSMKTGLPSAVANADLIQEIMPFWYTLKSATKVADLYTPANPNVPISFPLQTLQSMKFTIMPTITDGTGKGVLAALLAQPDTRAAVVSTISNLVLTNNFDGIDLDFENFAFVDGTSSWATTQPNWVAFIKSLAIALHANGKLLSVTTPVLFDPTSGKRGYYVYDWANIAPVIDRLRIMTYDYSTSNPGPIGPISWVESTVKYAVSVVPASKVYIGVAGYGRDWVTAVSGACPVDVSAIITPKAKAATFVMRDALNLAASYGVVPVFTPKFGESTFTYQKSYNGFTSTGLATSCTATRTAWYQDPQGYGVRTSLVAKYRLGGIAAWTIGMEDPAAMTAVREIAKSIAPDVVIATLSSSADVAILGNPITITGTFTLPDSRPIAGIPARLEIKNTLGDWRSVFSGTTGVDGRLSTPIILGELTSVRMVSEGSWERVASKTAPKDLMIKSIITWSPPTSIKTGVNYQISGQIQPKVAGETVRLEGVPAAAIGINATAMTDINGQFKITFKSLQSGFVRIRASTVANSKFAAGATDYFALLVR
jgi:spore germination protein YaaH